MSTQANMNQGLNPKLHRLVKIQAVIGVIAVVFTIAAAVGIYPLLKKKAELNERVENLETEKARLEKEIQQKNSDIKRLQQRIVEARGLGDTLNSISGKRKAAVLLALDLLDRGIAFKQAGRTTEGFDTSGFIDYILASPQIGLPLNIGLCNQACLMNLATPAATLGDLRPGDLIFYEYDQTLMYLGGENGKEQGIGMMFKGPNATIEIKDVNFASLRRPEYGKIAYGD